VQAKAGFVPNVFLALAHRPAEWRAFLDYHDALLLRDSRHAEPRAEREMIIVATSAANHCLYCVVAHGAILRIYEKKPLLADQVATNYRKADISGAPARDAGLRAEGLQGQRHEVDEADFTRLRPHGFSDDDIWDIGAITGLLRAVQPHGQHAGMRPNDEFYLLGRQPREKKS
jgi:uncharacterized peroxidase-related enzyme